VIRLKLLSGEHLEKGNLPEFLREHAAATL